MGQSGQTIELDDLDKLRWTIWPDKNRGQIGQSDRKPKFGHWRHEGRTIRTGCEIVADWLDKAKKDGLTGFWGPFARIHG